MLSPYVLGEKYKSTAMNLTTGGENPKTEGLCRWLSFTLPENNSQFAPENRPKPNRKVSYSNHPFLGARC